MSNYDEKGGQESWSHPTIEQTTANMMAFHVGQVDKSGVPYFNHPLRVMMRLGDSATDYERHAALLHDVVEDTDVTLEDLRALGYAEEVLEMVGLLTKKESMTHRQYIYGVIGSGNVGAMKIKLADMVDNSMPSRLEGAPEGVRENLAKMIESRYKPAIAMLRQVLQELAGDIIVGDMEVEVQLYGGA